MTISRNGGTFIQSQLNTFEPHTNKRFDFFHIGIHAVSSTARFAWSRKAGLTNGARTIFMKWNSDIGVDLNLREYMPRPWFHLQYLQGSCEPGSRPWSELIDWNTTWIRGSPWDSDGRRSAVGWWSSPGHVKSVSSVVKWSRGEVRNSINARHLDVLSFIVANAGTTSAGFAMPARTLVRRTTTRTSLTCYSRNKVEGEYILEEMYNFMFSWIWNLLYHKRWYYQIN